MTEDEHYYPDGTYRATDADVAAAAAAGRAIIDRYDRDGTIGRQAAELYLTETRGQA